MAFELKEEGFRLKDVLVVVGIPEATYHYQVKQLKKADPDQGWHYQHYHWVQTLKQNKIFQSMSRKATCADNAAMENFFGTLKSECLNRMKFSDRAEVEQAVAEYVQFYNFERINRKDGLAPYEIRSKAVESSVILRQGVCFSVDSNGSRPSWRGRFLFYFR